MFQKNKMILFIVSLLSLTSHMALGNQECSKRPAHWNQASTTTPETNHAGLIHLRANGDFLTLDLFCAWHKDCVGFLNGRMVSGEFERLDAESKTVSIRISDGSNTSESLKTEPFICSLTQDN